jgi:molecular chaperone DnaK
MPVVKARYELARAKLEQLVEDLIEKSRGPVGRRFPTSIRPVRSTSGSRWWSDSYACCQTLVRHLRSRHRGVNLIVVAGAAIQAGVLTGDVKDYSCSMSHLSPWVSRPWVGFTSDWRNTTIPTKGRGFLYCSDNQPSVEINVLQGA